MKIPEFEKEHLLPGQAISFIELNGDTHYGIYKGHYEAERGVFDFLPKESKTIEKIYVKEIAKFFRSL